MFIYTTLNTSNTYLRSICITNNVYLFSLKKAKLLLTHTELMYKY